MEFPMQLVCSECGRSLELSGDQIRPPDSDCPECRASRSVRTPSGTDASSPSHTPSSLELTPEDLSLGAWSNPIGQDIPAMIGRFRLGELLGGGGFGQVYRAGDSRLDRDVALKVLRDPRPPARVIERFFREARTAAQLDHPNIVPIHDAGRDGGRCWIAYQYVAGRTLAHYRDEKKFSTREAVVIVRALADALGHAHRRGVFHRDVKPANVIVDLDGRPRLTDFGLARRIDFDPTMTQEGAILGTPAYMSPEQAEGKSHQADARSDLYSLGVMLFELLQGERPHQLAESASTNPGETIDSMDVDPIGKVKLAPGLDPICRKALARDPAHRHPNARAFVNDLDLWLENHDARRSVAKKLATLALLGVAAIVGWGAKSWQAGPSTATDLANAKTSNTSSTITHVVARPRTADTPSISGHFMAQKGGRVFHRTTCEGVSNTPGREWIPLTLADVTSSDYYKPCLLCQPDLPTKLPEAKRTFATPVEAVAAGKIVATVKSDRYHWAKCQTVVNQMSGAAFSQYDSVDAAKAQHHTKPCQHCQAIQP